MKRIALAAVILAGAVPLARAAAATPPSTTPPSTAAPSADEAAIRAAVDSYVAAYNRGDAKAVAQHWSESGEWLSPSGQRFQGRQAIQREMEALLKENKGVHIEVVRPTVRMVAPDVALEEGTVRVLRPGEPADESTYIAIHVKKNGQWKLDSVRETSVPAEPAAASPLEDLAWMVGDWVDHSDDANIETSVKWTKNKSFLCCSFKFSVPGAEDLEGTQVIGWDPAAGTIRSWMFDSDGGFGEGAWSKKGNRWIVKFSQVLADGRKASAENIYTLVDGNTYTWQSIGREVDGKFVPNIEPVKVVRKTAVAADKAAEKPRKQQAEK
jgi:uncharacterized protein (TIGR02246 family)